MKTRFFKNVSTLEELKKEYRRLAFIHHPDKGGNAEDMKALNAEYDEMVKVVHKSSKATQEEKTTEAADMEMFRDIIEKLVNFENIEIEICGTWIWISGETKQYKKELKNIGFWWASKKQMWYWHSEEDTRKRKSNMSIDDIRERYGSQKVKVESTKQRIA